MSVSLSDPPLPPTRPNSLGHLSRPNDGPGDHKATMLAAMLAAMLAKLWG
ncbi:MAG: hypothetical protein LBF38_01380 [Deltaproteobacteria bacterium]|nr:hypothetical protein [Deltaproteobacteria bacterium]